MRVVIIGCGEIGILCAGQLQHAGHEVVGVRRNSSVLAFMDSRSADVLEPASLVFLENEDFDVVIYQVAAAGFTEQAYHQAYVQGLANVLEKCKRTQPHFLFVSSTGVYHQNDDSWVDEASETLPLKFNGQIMLEGERLVAAIEGGVSVRFSGIYGPNRTRLIDRVKSGQTGSDNDGYTNRIHVEDCAGVLAHLVDLVGLVATKEGGELQQVYLASDCAPALRSEVFGFLAEELGVAQKVSGTVRATADISSNHGPSGKRIAGSKRCKNQRLLDAGYQFIYPDYRNGYRQVISQLAS